MELLHSNSSVISFIWIYRESHTDFCCVIFSYDLINVMIATWENRHTVPSNYQIHSSTFSYYSVACVILTLIVIAMRLHLSTFKFEFY